MPAGLFLVPMILSMIVYTIAPDLMMTGGSVDWSPVITTLIPLIVGIILGNIDTDFAKVFTPGIGAILPLLGWNLGQGMNLVVALQSGVSGLLLTAIFLAINSYLFVLDNKIMKNDGVVELALLNVAGVSTSTPRCNWSFISSNGRKLCIRCDFASHASMCDYLDTYANYYPVAIQALLW